MSINSFFFFLFALSPNYVQENSRGKRWESAGESYRGTNCWIIYHDNDDAREGELENSVEENTLAENLSPLNSHPET